MLEKNLSSNDTIIISQKMLASFINKQMLHKAHFFLSSTRRNFFYKLLTQLASLCYKKQCFYPLLASFASRGHLGDLMRRKKKKNQMNFFPKRIKRQEGANGLRERQSARTPQCKLAHCACRTRSTE